jgi:acetolactate synthase I/II/III large subunit
VTDSINAKPTEARIAGIDPADVEAAARMLMAAKHPLVVTGSGAGRACTFARLLAEAVNARVIGVCDGKGYALDSATYDAFRLWADCDVMIGIGSRLETPYMRWSDETRLPHQQLPYLIRIDSEAAEFERLVPHIGILADAEEATDAVLTAVLRIRGGR